MTNTPPPGRRTTTSGRSAPPAASTVDLLVEIDVGSQAGHLQHIAQHLLAPAPLHPRPAAQGGGELARLVLGGHRGGQQLGDLRLAAPPVSSARAFSAAVTCGLELGQGVGHRLELGLQPGLGQGVLRGEALGGAFDQLLGHRIGRQRRLGFQHLGAPCVLLAQQIPLQRQAPRPRPLRHGPDRRADGEGGEQDRGDRGQERVHGPFVSGVARARQAGALSPPPPTP